MSAKLAFMDRLRDFAEHERELSSWWYLSRRSLLREFVSQALGEKHEARILDVGGTAELTFEQPSPFRVVNLHTNLRGAAFQRMHGGSKLVCTTPDEFAFASNCFDVVIAGDFLQS